MVDLVEGIVIAVLVMATASSGAVFQPGSWYEGLKKPGWTPPNWAFPVVWTVLYIMIGVAGWLVWRQAGLSLAMAIWGLQLLLNAAWSWLFFGKHRMDLALVDVLAMIALIAAFMLAAWPVSPIAALLFAPYLAWAITAACLNRAVWRLNPLANAG